MITSGIQKIGRMCIELNMALGRLGVFIFQVIKGLLPPYYFRIIWTQMIEIGYYSLPVIGLTAIFTGAVLALQTYTGFARFNASNSIASVVVISITRELGPVLAGLMLAGRVSAAIAAEIGTMRVTEQIDALRTLGTDPIRYLAVPRIISGIIALPLLVIIADIIGVFGGYLVGVYRLGFSPYSYLNSTFAFLETIDVVSGLVKAAAFGFIVTTIGCYNGYHSRGGAEGVGIATTNAVVASSIIILITNYIITGLFFAQ